jgi:hypothetical protein
LLTPHRSCGPARRDVHFVFLGYSQTLGLGWTGAFLGPSIADLGTIGALFAFTQNGSPNLSQLLDLQTFNAPPCQDFYFFWRQKCFAHGVLVDRRARRIVGRLLSSFLPHAILLWFQWIGQVRHRCVSGQRSVFDSVRQDTFWGLGEVHRYIHVEFCRILAYFADRSYHIGFVADWIEDFSRRAMISAFIDRLFALGAAAISSRMPSGKRTMYRSRIRWDRVF